MSGIRDTATVTLNVNGAQAKQFMADLEKQIQDTEAAIVDMQKKMADPKDIEKAKKQLKTYKKQLDEMRSATEGVNRALENIELATPRELEKALRTLNRQLKDMVPGSEVWGSHIEKIRELKARLSDLKDEMGEQQSLWERFNGWATQVWPSIDLLSRGYDALVSGMRSYVDAYAEMDQEMANVRKFTGMTEEQVESLNEAFKQIDTRTSREELNKLAQEAGRLGKTSEEDVLGFVRAADQINVALDDLGDGATLTLSKLTQIFGDEARYGTEQSLLKVGSVINELSQNCSASAPYLAEFASRLGGVGAQAGISVQQIMGFGAVLDANNQKVEASATALSQIIVRLYQDPAKYAKVAGLDVKKFTELLRKDANAAIIEFLTALNSVGGMDSLSPMFKDMGENGARALAALSTLASHIDEVKSQQEVANQAFAEGTSITKEFSVQNNTVQAGLDKVKKRFNELSVDLGQKLLPLMQHVITGTAALAKALMVAIDFISNYRATLATLTVAFIAYKAAVNLATIQVKLHSAAEAVATTTAKSLRAAKLLGAAASALFTGNLGKATAAIKLFSKAVRMSPIGLLVTVIGAVVGALTFFIEKSANAAKAQRELNNAVSEVATQYKSEKEKIDKLFSALKSAEKGTREYKAAKDEIINQYGQYLEGLINEKGELTDIAEAYNRVRIAARNAAAERGMEAQKSKLYEKFGKENQKDVDKIYQYVTNMVRDDKSDSVNSLVQMILSDVDAIGEISPMTRELLFESFKKGKTRNSNKAKMTVLNSVVERMVERQDKLNSDIDRVEAKFNGGINPYTNFSKEDLEVMKASFSEEVKQKDLDEYMLTLNGRIIKTYKNRADAALELSKIETALSSKHSEKTADPADPVSPPGGGGYTSTVLAEKEAKKSALEQKRAIAKAKAEYKAAMEAAKGEYEASMAENILKYSVGDISYEEYLAERERLDLKYVSDRKKVYESLYEGESAAEKHLLLVYDEDYQALLLKEAELNKKFSDENSKRRIAVQQMEYKKDLADLQRSFDDRDNILYGDELAQQEALHQLKIKYLKIYRDSYKSNSEEYADYDRQITAAELEWKTEKQKMYTKLIARYKKDYEKVSLDQRKAVELRVLEQLYDQKKISEKEYLDWKARIEKVYSSASKTDPDGDSSDASKLSKAVGGNSIASRRRQGIEKLDRQLREGKISVEEYEKSLKALDDELAKGMFDKFASGLDPLTQSVLNLGSVFADVFASISKDGKVSFENIAEIGAAAFATITASLEMYSQFAAAQSRIEIANVEKRYDREIARAQGNSYKTQKLEKEKEEKINKLKAEATERDFNIKVLQAIAQTAQNALLGYASGLMMPFPMNTWMPAVLAGMATAMGAVQIALIKKQQAAAAAEGYASGGFTGPGGVNEPAGVVHRGEWVASQKLLANPVARPLIEALDYVQRTNTIGSLRAEDVSRSITANNSLVRIAEGNNGAMAMIAVVNRMSGAVSDLTDRLNEPFVTVNTVTGDKGIKQAQDRYERLIRNVTPKSRRK